MNNQWYKFETKSLKEMFDDAIDYFEFDDKDENIEFKCEEWSLSMVGNLTECTWKKIDLPPTEWVDEMIVEHQIRVNEQQEYVNYLVDVKCRIAKKKHENERMEVK